MNNGVLKEVVVGFLVLVLVFSYVSSVFAITGSIKNARMIIRVDQGDKIERYIQVNNVNDVVIDVELFVSGDLEDYVDIKEDKFTLQPGESKKAYFTIEAKKAGTTETKINVKFVPQEGGNGVGLSSTVIIIAEDKGLFEGLFGGDSDDNTKNIDNDSDGDVSVRFGGGNSGSGNEISSPKDFMFFISISTLILAIIFIVLVVYASRMRSDKTKKSSKIKPKKSGGK